MSTEKRGPVTNPKYSWTLNCSFLDNDVPTYFLSPIHYIHQQEGASLVRDLSVINFLGLRSQLTSLISLRVRIKTLISWMKVQDFQSYTRKALRSKLSIKWDHVLKQITEAGYQVRSHAKEITNSVGQEQGWNVSYVGTFNHPWFKFSKNWRRKTLIQDQIECAPMLPPKSLLTKKTMQFVICLLQFTYSVIQMLQQTRGMFQSRGCQTANRIRLPRGQQS